MSVGDGRQVDTGGGQAGAAGIQLIGLTKSYGRQRILHELNLEVAPREFLSILGPSGSGKTTVLKIIAGFEEPDAGEVRLGERDMAGVPPERRDVGLVFQNYSLFPHMNVAENVDFPLRMRREPREAARKAVSDALAMVGLSGFEARRPNQLSGGQQQRVAIARAIVYKPKVLLMDEPLGALDRRLRGDMQVEIKALHERLGLTVVYITHDQDEALSMSDRIAVFNKGRIEQIGAPREVYRHPRTLFAANFLGDSLSVSAVVAGDQVTISGSGDRVRLPAATPVTGAAKLLWRSDQVRVSSGPPATEDHVLSLPAIVSATAYGSGGLRLRLELATGDLGFAMADEAATFAVDASVHVALDLRAATVLADPEGAGPHQKETTPC